MSKQGQVRVQVMKEAEMPKPGTVEAARAALARYEGTGLSMWDILLVEKDLEEAKRKGEVQ